VRVLELGAVAVLLFLIALAWLIARDRAGRRWAEAEAAARWEDAHEAVAGSTRVVVRRVARLRTGEERLLGESLVDEIPDGDPDWHLRFSTARQVAYDRAIDLNGRSLLG
jgi:hypothetical protein